MRADQPGRNCFDGRARHSHVAHAAIELRSGRRRGAVARSGGGGVTVELGSDGYINDF